MRQASRALKHWESGLKPLLGEHPLPLQWTGTTINFLVAYGRSDKKYARDDVGASQSCAKPAALARFRVIVGRAAASGARPETLLEGAREVFVARLAAAAF